MEVPSSLAHLLTINVEYKAVLCLRPLCCKAVSPVGLVEHLRKIHHEKPELRRQAEDWIQDLKRELRWTYNWATIQLPANGSTPQLVLLVVDGFRCLQCVFTTTSRDRARKHVSKEHLKKQKKDQEIFKRVQLQTWFKDGKERYWEVDESKEQELELEEEQELEPEREQELELEQEQELEPELELGQLVLSKSKHDMLKTYEFLQYPGLEETELHQLLLAWDRIRERALNTLESVDHKDALKWWVSLKNEVASQHPFELPDKSSTLTKYSQIWEQFICYVLRTAPAEFSDDTETGVVYTQEQWEAEQDEDGEEDEDFAEGDDEEEFSANMINNIIVRQASHG
ncbi:hypothetical protein VE02_10315 [Pseudogymnoascus sp. 03VT05]|nr:hypothetical protein VE02_10315 [Pseudogymnoascus sp. 03VT05]